MRTEAVRRYFDILNHKRGSLFCKRAFDICASFVMLAAISPLLLILALAIKLDSEGPVFYRQTRVTQYMRHFRIFKFRSMVANADKLGPLVTVGEDSRITKVGAFMRKYRLDELPQLINVLLGDMTFVGTRPEVEKYVERYTDEMNATLLLRAGVTSRSSIAFKDEAALLEHADDPDEVYVRDILPQKMKYNLEYLQNLSFFGDFKILFGTVAAVSEE